MAHQQKALGRPEPEHIDIEADEALRAWADSLGFAPEQVAAAIGVVGDCADAVCRHLHNGASRRVTRHARSGSKVT
jgi:hypothetical protein